MRVGVLASGEGTNLQALLDRVHGREGVDVVAVASDKRDARALERARAAGVSARAFEEPDRGARDAAIGDWLEELGVELVVLAGYMRLVSPGFLDRFPDRVINVHPALLPSFPGIGAVERALAHGAKVFGVTVPFVDAGVDTGPIIAQRALGATDLADAAELRAALRPLEHDLLCEVVGLIARRAVAVEGGRCIVRADDPAG